MTVDIGRSLYYLLQYIYIYPVSSKVNDGANWSSHAPTVKGISNAFDHNSSAISYASDKQKMMSSWLQHI